jgi:hypothetical protein
MDVLSSTTTELADARAQLNAKALIKEDKEQKKGRKHKPGEFSDLRVKLAISAHSIHQDPHSLHPFQLMQLLQRWRTF